MGADCRYMFNFSCDSSNTVELNSLSNNLLRKTDIMAFSSKMNLLKVPKNTGKMSHDQNSKSDQPDQKVALPTESTGEAAAPAGAKGVSQSKSLFQRSLNAVGSFKPNAKSAQQIIKEAQMGTVKEGYKRKALEFLPRSSAAMRRSIIYCRRNYNFKSSGKKYDQAPLDPQNWEWAMVLPKNNFHCNFLVLKV